MAIEAKDPCLIPNVVVGDADVYDLPSRGPRLWPINWCDALPASSRYTPDSAEAGLIRWAHLFESDVVSLMESRGVDIYAPRWQVAGEWRGCQEELLTTYMRDLFVSLRERVMTFEPMGQSLN